ncbi:MAG: cell division protein FtsQ/DivIB [Betaproteobacteria bacterium]
MWDDVKALNAAAVTLATLVTVALVASVLAWTLRQPAFAFRDVVVTAPLARADAAHVEAVLRGELHGTFFTLDLDAARAALHEVPWVKHVALRRQWPARLEVTIDEFTPLARWNEAALVDDDGEVFAADFNGELPQFTGPVGRAAEIAERYREFRGVLAPMGLALTGIRLTPRGSWSVTAAHEHGALAIELGRNEPSQRLMRLAGTWPRTIGALMRAGTNVDYVDLRYRAGFAARIPGFREKPKKAA